VAIICTPLYIRIIGEARYGILALVWLLFGYFGLFEFGLSRATSNRLAKAKDASREERAAVFWTALLCNLGLGICGGLVFLLVGKQLMSFYIKVPDALTIEINHGLPWIALLIPLATMNGVFVAALEASERFIKLNILQIIGSTIFQVLPLVAVAMIAPRIDTAIVATVIGRSIAIVMIAVSALWIIGWSHVMRTDRRIAGQLFRYGGWVTIGSIIAPLVVTVDQFVIGAMIGIQTVAYYSVSYSVTGRTVIIPLSLSRALFPRLSQHAPEKARNLTVSAITFLANTTAGLYAGGDRPIKVGFRNLVRQRICNASRADHGDTIRWSMDQWSCICPLFDDSGAGPA